MDRQERRVERRLAAIFAADKPGRVLGLQSRQEAKQNNDPPILAKLWKNSTLRQGAEDQPHCQLIVFVSRSDSYFMSFLSVPSAGTGFFLRRPFPKSVPLLKLEQE
jgi:hypothetical protein